MSAVADPAPGLTDACAEEMAARYAAGGSAFAEEFFERHPELSRSPEAAFELVAEELALRAEYGPPAAPGELAARFPQWRARVEALAECQRLFGPSAPPPASGERLGEFDLVRELGSGAHGRVFLAAQPNLGGRRVVLKLGPAEGAEHISLARLQHTHVVPLYGAAEFPERGLRALVMPDFGGRTLESAQFHVQTLGRPATGRDLWEFVRAESAGAAPAFWGTLLERPAWWAAGRIGACLADALRAAHDRGLLHLDIKPSNILIAGDGTPMLLDFHLAHPPLAAGESPAGRLGGTPGYMAPEHAWAVEAVRAGEGVPGNLDGRADVFSLGRTLAGFLGAAGGRPSRGLIDILDKATAPDPAGRYATAAEFASDLRRHLADLPLRGVRNRSLGERLGKWRRRNPLAAPAILLAGALAAGLAGAALGSEDSARRARAYLEAGRAEFRAGRVIDAASEFRAAEAALVAEPLRGTLRAEVAAARRGAEARAAAQELRAMADRVRLLTLGEIAPDQARALAAECQAVVARRGEIAERLAASADDGPDWKPDLLDLAVAGAALEVGLAEPVMRPELARRALADLDAWGAGFGPSAALEAGRFRLATEAGDIAAARRAELALAATPSRSAADSVRVGRALEGLCRAPEALAEFERARRADPRSVWAHAAAGATLLRSGDSAGAWAAFGAAVALEPGAAWCWYNRALAARRLGRVDDALADLARALELAPAFTPATAERDSLRRLGR